MEKSRFEKLPKYAQREIEQLEDQITLMQSRMAELQKAHDLLINPAMDWFTIGAHTPEKRNLYFLDKDHPNHVATIGAGSIIMIAHPNNK